MVDHPEFHGEKHLENLVAIAAKTHLAEVDYRKGVTRDNITTRVVEPYSFTRGKQDMMVRCYQKHPEKGWRFFMIHKLDRVADTGRKFKPRTKITLPDAIVNKPFQKSPAWTSTLKMYRNMVCDAMADGKVTSDELLAINKFKQENEITQEQTRFVHASLFHRCLGTVLEDDIFDTSEVAQIKFLHNVLHALGWSIAD